MSKSRQKELILQGEMLGHKNDPKKGPRGLRGQGFWAEKMSEQFKAGRPDLRVARCDVGQCDFELKYNDWPMSSLEEATDIDSGMTKLQWLNVRWMNEAGVPAICLIYFEALDQFRMTTDRILCGGLSLALPTVLKLPTHQIIDGVELVTTAKEHLRGLGYKYV